MLNYYYDVILGLQYTYLGGFLSIDLDSVPKLPADLVLKMFMEQGVKFLESSGVAYSEINLEQITNYQL